MNNNQEYLDSLRHSAAHLLAASVLELWPDTKITLGPPVRDGFYYDMDFAEAISESDLPKIEARMHELVNTWREFKELPVSPSKAKEQFKGNPYKLELIDEIVEKREEITLYQSGNFIDLCRGGHVDNPSHELQHFKLLSLAGAYWRGSEKNKMLTRIYGTVFRTKEELEGHLHQLEEAKKRDHRKIGRELELYFIDDLVGKGLIMWLPKGTIVRDQIQRYAEQEEEGAGYQRVVSPHIAKKELFLMSGHLPYYEKDMFPGMEMDDGIYYLKAMNCPHHHRIYQHVPRSYRDLPLRFAEYGTVYRNELSGTLAGLLRVRGMAMNDAHIYCRKDQIKEEFKAVLHLTMANFRTFNLHDYWFRLSKWDPAHADKYINEPENWDYAQNVLKEVLQEESVEFVEADNEAAFYGPKVDVQFTSVIGREETMSTIQLDFMAKQRFGLSYTDAEGHENNEVFVIHRAPLSVHERFLAFLIEHYAGAFPAWLAPVQVAVIPISEKHTDIAQRVYASLQEAGIRIELDADNKTVSAKIRHHTLQKVPYMCIIGDSEAQKSGSGAAELHVSVRTRGGVDKGMMSLTAFKDQILYEISNKKTE